MIALQIILIISLLTLFVQDLKDRAVWFFLPYLQIVLGGILFYLHSTPIFFGYSILINLLFIAIMIASLYLTTKYILKKKFYNHSFGLADILLYVGIAVSFPTITFIVCFIGSLLFTITLYLVFKILKFQKLETVPLAGSIALFLTGIYVLNWFGIFTTLYTI